MSAAHCFDTLIEYDQIKSFYVGTHELTTKGSGGHVMTRKKIDGIDKNGVPVLFPIRADEHGVETDLIDIAIITVKGVIPFSNQIKQVRLALYNDPTNNCKTCSGDCDPSNSFKVYGWGDIGVGTQEIVVIQLKM